MSLLVVMVAALAYMGALFLIAAWVERRRKAGSLGLVRSSWVYALSLGVYCSAWTYYGSVGSAARSGMYFLGIYFGASLSMLFAWTLGRKLIRIKERQRITSIADLVSARYGKSQALATLVMAVCVLGVVPYIALQLKAIVQTTAVMTSGTGADGLANPMFGIWAPVVALLAAGFTILFGLRRIDPTERHPGMVMALTVECGVKLLGILAIGGVVVFVLFKGPTDILSRVSGYEAGILGNGGPQGGTHVLTWFMYILLGFSAFLLLPRQFQIAVVENNDERHLGKAMWVAPLYLMLISIFAYPIAVAGLEMGMPLSLADTFVLRVPLQAGYQWLSLLVFLGGFSAATGMIMLETMALATMVTNHAVLPLVSNTRWSTTLTRRLLPLRWLAALGIIALGYAYAAFVGPGYSLVDLGLTSFSASLQLAPAVFGGLYWRQANRAGALLGIVSGFLVWSYTLILPAFVRSGWLPAEILTAGPFGVYALRPEALFGIEGMDRIAHSAFWSLVCNFSAYALGSMAFEPTATERLQVDSFLEVSGAAAVPYSHIAAPAVIPIEKKEENARQLLRRYFPPEVTERLVREAFSGVGDGNTAALCLGDLAELQYRLERILTGSIGAAAAHTVVRKSDFMTGREKVELSRYYARVLTELSLSPSELSRRIDYYRDRQTLLLEQADELARKVQELARENSERISAEAKLSQSEEKYRSLVDNMNVGIVRVLVDGSLLHGNRAFAAMFGLLEQFDTDRVNLFEFCFRASDRDELLRCLHEKGEARDVEVEMRRKDGSFFWASITAVAHKNGWGQLEWFDGIIEDVSERKELESKRERLLYQERVAHELAEQAVRLREEFISIASHELKTPLATIKMWAHALRKLADQGGVQPAPPEKISRIAQSTGQQVDRLTLLVENLLDSSRIRTGKMTLKPVEVDVSELVRETVARFRSEFGAKARIQSDIAGGVRGLCDPSRLEQALGNLINNAIKFGQDKPILVSLEKQGSHAVIRVQDHGIGISEENRFRIFNPYEQAVSAKNYGGLGLGLYISKQIIEAHGGSIEVDSEQGRGSSFSITLNLEPAQSQAISDTG